MKAALTVVALAGFLSGCAASGVQVKEEQLSQFERGKTTTQEVLSALGPPSHSTLMPNGNRIFIYSYAQIQTRPETFIPFVGAFVGGADMKTNSATLIFDGRGILQSVSASSGATGTGMGLASGTGAPERVPEQPKQAPASLAVPTNRPVLGIKLMDLPPALASSLGRADQGGVMVVIVTPGTAAEKAGLLPGDVITAYNGKPIRNQTDLLASGDTVNAGSEVPLHVLRGNKDMDLVAKF